MKPDLTIVFGVVCFYIVITTYIGARSLKYNKNTANMMSAKSMMGPSIVGILLMSEFIGTSSTLGTAQTAFDNGIWAAWNLISLGIGFLLYSYFMAPKIQASGEYTISGVLSKAYGQRIQIIASFVMSMALISVNVSQLTGGGATIAKLLGISIPIAVIVLSAASIIIVALGGLRGVGYTNLIHASFKYMGLIILCVVAYGLYRHGSVSFDQLPANYWTPEGLGVSKIIAWTIANIGAVFSTQYVLQSISSLDSPEEAKKASIIAAIMIVPVGAFATFIGLAAKVLFPDINSINAIPEFLTYMNSWVAGIVVAAILASTFVTMLACTIGSTALIMKDFIIPYVRPKEKNELSVTRTVAVTIGLLSIPFALFVPGLLKVVFFARALRTILGVLVIFAFYAPCFASRKGAIFSVITTTIVTVLWFVLVNSGPIGDFYIGGILLKTVDNIYLAALLPVIFMVVEHVFTRHKISETDAEQEI